MIKSPPQLATAVVARNSLAYVAVVLAQSEARRTFVNVASESEAGRLAGVVVDHCVVPEMRTGWYSTAHPLVDEPTPAQVTYTSGTTGRPKGIVLTHANLSHVARRLIDEMQLTDEIREYVGVPATYSFGIGRFRAIAAVGGQAYLPPRGFDPLELARMLDAGEVNALSAVPTLLRVLLADPSVLGSAGGRLRWLEIGSQYLAAEEKRQLRALFPNARIVQHYGLTEASRTTFLNVTTCADSELDSVGRPAAGNDVALTADGRIRIRGPHVARWRVDENGLHNLLDDDGWLTTNDRGRIEAGCLFYEGRADDLINCAGIKLVPDLIEAALRETLGGDARLAVARVPDARRGDGVLVAFERSSGLDAAAVRAAAVRVLRTSGVEAGDSLHVQGIEALPTTVTGKLQRSRLTEAFRPDGSEPEPARVPLEFDSVLDLFRQGFPGEIVGPDDSFESLGGDSLTYIQFSMTLEKRLGSLPGDWHRLTVAQLQALASATRRSRWRRLESSTFMRAVSVFCIVALHVEAFVYSRNHGAATMLILLTGYSVARFQLPEIIQSGSVRTVLRTALRVAIPTVLVVAVMQVLVRQFQWLPLLLVSNWSDPFQINGFSFYFLEVYIQLLLLAALLFSSRHVRDAFSSHPMRSALLLLAAVVAADQLIYSLWNTDYLFNRVPHRYAWIFASGVLMGCASSLPSRLVAFAVVSVGALIAWGTTTATGFVVGGSALVLFVRALVVPKAVKFAVSEVAAASMFIYLSHFQVWEVVQHGPSFQRSSIALGLALVCGIAFAHAYGYVERRALRSLQGSPAAAGTERASETAHTTGAFRR